MKVDALKIRGFCWLSSLCLAVFLSPLASYALTVEEVPNPRQVHGGWVTDMADVLTDGTETQLNQMISQLEVKNGAEIAVVTVPETAPAASPKEFTTKLFNYWGIGKKGKDNGVLFLISLKDRRVEIETGYGVEAILPDAKVGNIINTEITPRFKQRDFDGGTLAGTKALIVVIEPSLKAELNENTQIPAVQPVPGSESIQPYPAPTNDNIPWIFLFGGGGLAIGLGGIAAYLNNRVFLKPEGRSRRMRQRLYRVYCSQCKQPMEKVDDDTVQPYLSQSEKVAQDIGSIKFEGWKCPQCSQQLTGEKFHLIGWVSSAGKFQKCPHCQEWTMKRTEKTLIRPTQYRHGKRLITDTCHCCSYHTDEEKRLPRLHVASSGGWSSSSSGGSSGSSGGGGSFGGGSSGGGGAGSNW